MLRVDEYQPNVAILSLTYCLKVVQFCFKIKGHVITAIPLYDYAEQFI